MERKSFLEYQLKEINNTNPSPNEDEELENNLKKLALAPSKGKFEYVTTVIFN